ncbi:MAG TPA: hypothetical protein PKK61_09555, partial [Defluviitaleaceae bacterium]|nr:hypothetical protein [Defluviitaleaceae bacterium]
MNTFIDAFMEGEIKITKRVFRDVTVLEIRDSVSTINLYFHKQEDIDDFVDKLNFAVNEKFETAIEPVEMYWDDVVETWMEISDVKNEITIDKNAG